MTRILVTGDSHIGALKRAYDLAPEQFQEIDFAPLGSNRLATGPFFTTDDKQVTVLPLRKRKQTFHANSPGTGEPSPLLVVSLPLHTARILRNPSWRTHVPWQLLRDDTEYPMSDQALTAMFAHDSKYALEFVVALKSLSIDVLVLEAPRFFENAPYLSRTRFDVCCLIDKGYRNYVRARLSDEKIDVIPQPSETITDYGTTMMDFNHENPNDAHHANAEYGHLALNQIVSCAAAR